MIYLPVVNPAGEFVGIMRCPVNQELIDRRIPIRFIYRDPEKALPLGSIFACERAEQELRELPIRMYVSRGLDVFPVLMAAMPLSEVRNIAQFR
jgi:hypothetical protein